MVVRLVDQLAAAKVELKAVQKADWMVAVWVELLVDQ
jgi:hypothetical protein